MNNPSRKTWSKEQFEKTLDIQIDYVNGNTFLNGIVARYLRLLREDYQECYPDTKKEVQNNGDVFSSKDTTNI